MKARLDELELDKRYLLDYVSGRWLLYGRRAQTQFRALQRRREDEYGVLVVGLLGRRRVAFCAVSLAA